MPSPAGQSIGGAGGTSTTRHVGEASTQKRCQYLTSLTMSFEKKGFLNALTTHNCFAPHAPNIFPFTVTQALFFRPTFKTATKTDM